MIQIFMYEYGTNGKYGLNYPNSFNLSERIFIMLLQRIFWSFFVFGNIELHNLIP